MEPIYTNPETENRPVSNEPDPEAVAQMKSGANWFYWIAGLSLVNSAIYAFGGDISFILGLAATQMVEGITDAAIAEGLPSFLKAVAIVINLVITNSNQFAHAASLAVAEAPGKAKSTENGAP